jgi:Family of unknown function (DUF6444)
VTGSLPEDRRDALIHEQAGQIAALTELVAQLREQLDAALRAASRNSGNSSVPPSAEDLPGRRPPARKERRAAGRAEKERKPGKQPGSPGAAVRWEKPDEVVGHFPQGAGRPSPAQPAQHDRRLDPLHPEHRPGRPPVQREQRQRLPGKHPPGMHQHAEQSPPQGRNHLPARRRFWALQWTETGIFLAAALVLAGFCFWSIRRRRLSR